MQFRTEAFNLFNRTHFGIPGRTVFTRTGVVTDTALAIRSSSQNARQVQLGLKLSF